MSPNLLQKHYDVGFYERYRMELSEKGFVRLGQGASRTAYIRGKIVIKTPHNQGGYVDNIMEAYAYRTWRNKADNRGRIFAPCRLLPNGCLMMVHVKRMDRLDMPDWTHSIDGAQCGKYKDRFVVYDSGYDLYYTDDVRERSIDWAGVSG
jgi:hypothetical protein